MVRRVFASGLLLAALAQAAVTRVEITERTDVPVAGYERLAGKVYFTVNPRIAANQMIADIGLAPVNDKKLVEFSADLLVLRPKDPAKSNGTAFLEIVNRGTPAAWPVLNVGAARGMRTEKDFGDAFMLEQGFTMVWVGWQFDVTGANNIKLYAPVVPNVTGPVRAEILVNQTSTSQTLPYPVADAKSGTLTVRDRADGNRMTLGRDQWSLNGESRLEFPSGFEPGRIYDFVYTAKDPAVAGLGMAAVRDYVSYMKQQGEVKRAIGMGISQSGRFLRTFLADGFNADEKGKKVFDAVWAHVAGGGHGDFNQRFAQPSRTTGEYSGIFYPTDLPPYHPDDLLANVVKAGVAPKLMITYGSHEYWGRAAGLNHITEDGASDVEPSSNIRIYYVAGTQHGTGGGDMKGLAQNRSNPMDWSFVMRATVVSLNSWITKNTAPPPSQFPHIAKGEFVSVTQLRFPKIPGVAVVREAYAPRRLDFGPDFLTKGIVSIEPPTVGEAYPALVPQVDADGNEISGIRLPELRVPLATYTGWNLRDPKIGAPTEQYPLTGSMIPFARTQGERYKSNDPRLSIAERYADQQEYLTKIEAAAHDLAKNRFLLESDIPQVVARAKQRWDSLQ